MDIIEDYRNQSINRTDIVKDQGSVLISYCLSQQGILAAYTVVYRYIIKRYHTKEHENTCQRMLQINEKKGF